MKHTHLRLSAAFLFVATGCGSDAADLATDDVSSDVLAVRSAPDAAQPAASSDVIAFRTDDIEIQPGKEAYICFSKLLEEDAVINAYETAGAPFVHHALFFRTRSPEPLGFRACTDGFSENWDPLFIVGAGPSSLAFPSDAGHTLAKGTQLLVQLHLFNTGEEVLKGPFEIKMRRSAVKNPRPVNGYAFGTTAVQLPPKQTSQIVATCKMTEPVQLVGLFPHMHLLGTSLKFEVGTSADTMKEVFRRAPYSFDNQAIERVDIALKPGDLTRLTCTYNNVHPFEVRYGESSNDEMCYLIASAVDRTFGGACFGAGTSITVPTDPARAAAASRP